jgi:putative nucleotidyltransferase with HDIG domain
MTKSPSPIAPRDKIRREILHQSELIPPLPDLVVRLLHALAKPDTEPQQLEDLMQNDQVLVAKMMAIVNSPFYGLSRSIRTVKEAVMVLGFRGVRSLVLASSAAKYLQRDYVCYGHEPKGLWLHAACVAAASRALAKSCRLAAEEAEQLFVAGLLHDIGKLLLAAHRHEYPRATAPAFSDTESERAALGLDHAEAGALVAAKWHLSPEVQRVIGTHHDTKPGVAVAAVAIVRLADAVAHERGIGYLPGCAPAPVVLPQDLEVLGLTPASWSSLRDELAVTMDEVLAGLADLGA